MAECMTSGATTPATSPLTAELAAACKEEAMPRREGTTSSASKVTAGVMSAQPKEKMAMGTKAHHALGGSRALAARLMSEIAAVDRKSVV